MRGAYYNEHDEFAARWLQNLIAENLIAPGDVDIRSIDDVSPDDLRGYSQCHFFAGIGVWSHALRSAGWPDDRPVWTGSCPCQAFSGAGKKKGFADERHLWPAFFHLIEECRPGVVFGEQVASKDALAWLDLVQADMEGTDYSFAAIDLCAAGFGAPHIRQRLYWVGNTERVGGWWHSGTISCEEGSAGRSVRGFVDGPKSSSANGWVDDANGGDAGAERQQRGGQQRQQPENGSARKLADASGSRFGSIGRRAVDCIGHQGAYAHVINEGTAAGSVNGIWRDADWLLCRDGKWRPVEPGTFPLVTGASGRVGCLRAYGNALNSAQAQGFIEAYLEIMPTFC